MKFVMFLLRFFPPEVSHFFALNALNILFKIKLQKLFFPAPKVSDTFKYKGLVFKNKLGIAAGLDKNGDFIDSLGALGFGFIEIGTTTPLGQEGNPKKRLFRLKDDKGIINRMGFNNKGLDKAITELKKNKGKLIIGGNIGKNTQTLPEHYTQDYLTCFNALHPYVDYFVLNVSCPNVGSHAKLNDKAYLEELIGAVQQANNKFAAKKPILLKIAPDLNTTQLDEIVTLVLQTKLDGVIASNTSTNREGLSLSQEELQQIGNGGLSGQPIKDRSTAVIKHLSSQSNKAFPIIGVGGIHSPEDALEKINAGADLLQIYTGFIYEGPRLIKNINKAIISQTA